MPRTQPPSTSRQQWEMIQEENVDPIMSTSDVAEIFGKSTQWIYWGLRTNRFLDDDGNPLEPRRFEGKERSRRIWTVSLVKDMARSCYMRGTINLDQLTKIMYRIKQTSIGIEWRKTEGWRYVDVGRNRHRARVPGEPGRLRRYRWVPPHQATWSKESNDYVLRDGAKKKRRKQKDDDA